MNLPKLFAATLILLVVIALALLLVPILYSCHTGNFTEQDVDNAKKWVALCLITFIIFFGLICSYGAEKKVAA